MKRRSSTESQDGAGVSQYQRYKDEGITSSQIGNMNAYNSIRGVNKVEALEANGIDAATGGQADAHKDAGSVKGEQMGEAFEKEHGMGYGDLAAKGGFHRLLKSSTEYKTANDNGWETITTDFNGNVIGREGYYAKMNVDTDGDGVGMEMTNVRYNSATGELSGIYNGKTYTMKGNFLDADGSDGTLSIDPAMTTVRSGSDIQKLDRDLETTEKGTTGAFHDEHTVNIDGQTRTMSGSIQQSGNSFYGKNLIDKETGMSYSIEATGERGADGSFNLKSAVIEGKGTMDTLTTSDGTVLKSAKVNAYGSNFDDMRMVIEGTTTENGKAMDVSAKAQGRIEDGQILGDFSVLDKKASEMTTDRRGTDIETVDRNVTTVDKGLRSKVGDESRVVDIDTETYDRGVNYGGIFAASLQQDKAAEVAAQPILKAKEASYDAETGTYDLQKYKDTFSTHSDAQSKDWASGAGQIMTSRGLIATSFDMGAKGQIGVHGSTGMELLGNGIKVQTSADAGLSINRKNTEEHNTNLLYSMDKQMQQDAAALATDSKGNFDDKAYSEILGAMRYDATNQIVNAGSESTEFKFGASALISESVAPTINEIKEMNSAMANVMTGKDASLLNASPETKATMLEGLKARAGTAPDGSSGLDSLIEKYKSESSGGNSTSNHVPNPFK